MERRVFVAEGKMEIGPMKEFFVFLDGHHLGALLVDHFRLVGESGYCDLGRVRITVEQLEKPEA